MTRVAGFRRPHDADAVAPAPSASSHLPGHTSLVAARDDKRGGAAA